MKALEQQFVSGEGGYTAEPLTYTQIARNTHVAVYERSRDGIVKDYEVFRIKVLKKGHKIFKQVLDDDTEQYPSTGQFGRLAWSITGGVEALPAALARYDKLIAEPVTMQDDVDAETGIVTQSVAPGKRGRKPAKRATVIMPTTATWTMSDILALNPDYQQPTMYVYIQKQIAANKVFTAGFVEREAGRGKKPVLYTTVAFDINDVK